MPSSRWDEQFFSTSRGRIVQLVRSAPRTVDELARALGLTDNAIRTHLAMLDRDGLVHRVGERRGERKPSALYGPTLDAERLFPKAYGPVLGELLGALDERLGPQALKATLHEVGHRLAGMHARPTGSPLERARAAGAVLEELGAAVSIEPAEEGATIRGASCPLATVVASHPGACQIVESLLRDLTDLDVHEQCDRAGQPRCCFVMHDRAA